MYVNEYKVGKGRNTHGLQNNLIVTSRGQGTEICHSVLSLAVWQIWEWDVKHTAIRVAPSFWAGLGLPEGDSIAETIIGNIPQCSLQWGVPITLTKDPSLDPDDVAVVVESAFPKAEDILYVNRHPAASNDCFSSVAVYVQEDNLFP